MCVAQVDEVSACLALNPFGDRDASNFDLLKIAEDAKPHLKNGITYLLSASNSGNCDNHELLS